MKNIGLMIRNMVQYEQEQKDLINEKFSTNSIENSIFEIIYAKFDKESDDVLKDIAIEISVMLKDKGFI